MYINPGSHTHKKTRVTQFIKLLVQEFENKALSQLFISLNFKICINWKHLSEVENPGNIVL